ncbi:MAG TPA: low affinity iron permease family protein [Chitinophagales bacterium]|nr:low affinity iron permease family protein [Chitinophagales bacterium]
MKKISSFFENIFEILTEKITLLLGHSITFLVALLIVIAWLSLDIVNSSSLHNLVNDFVFSFTFLMVFIIQKSQNKFSTVINIKLNELVASHENASNRLIKVEDMTERELRELAAHYETLSAHLDKSNDPGTSASIEHVIEEIKGDADEKKKNEEDADS